MRPQHLPDFNDPPLNELVVGVQFAAIPGYDLINAGEVHSLYRDRYPSVELRAPQPPFFETFGAPATEAGVRFEMGMQTSHPRFWFISEDKHDLVQFETTRFMHNWRQIDGIGGKYPRYEAVMENFKTELAQLDGYSFQKSKFPLQITQAEISYINRIYATEAGSWPFEDLSFLSLPVTEVELGGGYFQRVYETAHGLQGRLYTEFATNRDSFGNPFILFSQTFRGAPDATNIESAIEFIDAGRQIVVESFSKLTTERAHQKWKRTK